MPAIKKNLTFDKGATAKVSVRYSDVSTGTKVPVNLTGYSAWLTVFSSRGAVLLVITPTLTNDGWIKSVLTDEQTTTLPVGKGSWQLDIQSPDGTRERLFFGDVTIRGLS